MDKGQEYAIGLDLGGTKILTALIDQHGTVVAKVEAETLAGQGKDAVIGRVLETIQALLAKSSVQPQQIRGVGAGIAGVIDANKGEVMYSKNLGWTDVPLGRLIHERFSLPVRLGNDANVAAIGEWLWGAGKGRQDVVYITVSTGIGAGIIAGNRLLAGIDHNAGEFGHMSINMNGPACACGNRGCLELYASGTALAHIARQRLTESASAFLDSRLLTAKDIGQAAMRGDAFSIGLLEEAGYHLGIGVTNLIHLLNPEMIVFGGSVMTHASLILPQVERAMEERGIRTMTKRAVLTTAALGKEAGAIGAAGLFFSE